MAIRQIEVCDVCNKDAKAELRLGVPGAGMVDVCADCIARPMTEVRRVLSERTEEQRKQAEAQMAYQQSMAMRQSGRLG